MKKLCPGSFTLSVMLASIMATLPFTNAAASGPEGVRTQTKTITVYVPAPLPGQPIQLPDTVPQQIRADVIKILNETPPGQAVVLAPPGTPADLVEQATQGVGPVDQGGSHPLVWGCLGWILVIVVVIVIAVIIYVVWKCCQLLNPPPQTNAPPDNPNPAVVRPKDLTPQATPLLSLESPTISTTGCDIQVNTDLSTTNWWTLASLTANQALTYTNATGSLDWAVVTARDTNGVLLCSTLIEGSSTNGMVGTRPLSIPYPGPHPDKLFFRLVPR